MSDEQVTYLSRYIVCELCEERPATLTLHDNLTDHYICDQCAKEKYPGLYDALEK